jgi:primosomal protein N' (replication factor Y)
MRVRVPLGARKVTGWFVDWAEDPGVPTRPIAALLDREPLLSADLLELAVFVAEYYLEPLGETLRGLMSSEVPAWGERSASLTVAGLMSADLDERQDEVLLTLQERGPGPVGELVARLGGPGGIEAIEELEARGAIRLADRSGGLYRKGVALASIDPAEITRRVGRSAKGREVVAVLEAAGRPMLVEEIAAETGASAAVISRLEKLGVVSSFTQVGRLDLARHRLHAPAGAPPFELLEEQQLAVGALATALDRREYAAFLLHGVTGAGKTEVYLRAVARALEGGGSAIILVPEIGLVPALAAAVRQRFGGASAILHSGLATTERRQEWERIRVGEARIVVGPRSAVFAPVVNLRLIVVDEEQDGAYKQDQSPRYNGRDVALVRARAARAVAVLASATPSLESVHNVSRGKLSLLRLPRRVGGGALPETSVVDLRAQGWAGRPGEVSFSPLLLQELGATLGAGGQAVLLRNRRGYAPMLLCRACGEDHRCDDCGLPRTLHRRAGTLRCHYCGSSRSRPRECGRCGADALEPMGSGTERVEEELRALMPGVPLAVLDADVAARPGGAARVLEEFAAGQAKVLIGTQMVAKGHHFPEVALAAVLAADSYLGFPDFRAVERTWALLTQLAGRAGRGDRPGRFIIQSWHPEHYAIRAVVAQDEQRFLDEELRFRRAFAYPPFTRMVALLVSHPNQQTGAELARELGAALQRVGTEGVRIAGPAPAPLERLRGAWRWQILVRGPSIARVRAMVAEALATVDRRHVVVDVDPLDLL